MARGWWQSEKDVHSSVIETAHRIADDLQIEETFTEWMRLVFGRRYTSVGRGRLVPERGRQSKTDILLNSIQNIQQTIVAHTCVHRPRPRFLTVDGDWSLRRRAQKLQRYCEGTVQQCDGYEQTTAAFEDAVIFGTGFVKVYPSRDRVIIERVWPGEVLVDELGCGTAPPRFIMQRKWVPREILIGLYPDKSDDIEADSSSHTYSASGRLVETDTIEVVEAWHLPSGEGADDGRHVIAMGSAALLDEPWTRREFPFAVCRWTRIPVGYYGQGLTEQLRSLQMEKDKLLRRIQRAQQLFATVNVIAEEGSINKDLLTNEAGSILWVKPGARPPVVHTPASMNGQVFDHAAYLDRKEYEIAGISQFTATSTKPAGDLSGVALHSLRDVQAQRHSMAAVAWDKLHLDVYRLIVSAAREAYVDNAEISDFEARYSTGAYYQSIKWSDVDLDRDAYKLELWPTNILPAEPSGKLATVQELLAGGLIDRDVANRLLDFPDLDEANSLHNAALNLIDWAIEKMFDTGVVVHPQPYWNLPLSLRRVGQEILRATVEGAPESSIEVLEEWLEEAAALLSSAQPEPEPMPGPAGPLSAPISGAPPEGDIVQ